jgi:phage-related minor tail protein
MSASRSVFDAAWSDVRAGDPAPRLDAITAAARAAAQRLSQQIRRLSRVIADTNVEAGAAAGETVDDSRG